jgi:membrane protease YdiL (CAAX protease family)
MLQKQLLAVVEVTVVTAAVHFAYKALKLVEPWGHNYSPGLVMIAATVVVVFWRPDLRWRDLLGVNWQQGLAQGLVLSLVLLAAGILEYAVIGLPEHKPLVTTLRLAYYLSLSIFAFWVARRSLIASLGPKWTIPLLITILVLPIAVAIWRGAPGGEVLSRAISLACFTAFGEELFFRGYVLCRLNAVFGRPLRLAGISFGAGLFISAFLFGLIHVANPTLWYHGQWKFDPWWGAVAFASGLLYGYLREMTDGIWAGTAVHGLSGVYRGIAQLYLSR